MSHEKGKAVLIGCEFEGKLKDNRMQTVDAENGAQINGNILELENEIDQKICAGFGQLQNEFLKVSD